MDPQIRNFKDFLQLYNRLTEMCFSHCVDNFFNRNLSTDEAICIDRCVSKFTCVNQKIMGIYVEAQSVINERRMVEIEEHAIKTNNELLQQHQQQQQQSNSIEINSNNNQSTLEDNNQTIQS